MNLFALLWTWVVWPCALYFGGSKSSSSSSTNTTNQYDNRVVSTVDDRDTSFASNTSTTYNGTDPGLAQISATNAQLLGAVAETQRDSIGLITGLGAKAFDDVGLTIRAAGDANDRAWSHTVDASQSVIEKLLTTTQGTTDAAKALAQSAIASYQPSENKSADTFKYVGIALALALGAFAFAKA